MTVAGIGTGTATIGEIMPNLSRGTLIHLTPEAETAFAQCVNQGTSFARLRCFPYVSEYQATVVGSGAATGPGQAVSGFVTATPDTQGAFGYVPISNLANVPEFVNGVPFLPYSYVPIP